jgi:oligogalacturonide lyase
MIRNQLNSERIQRVDPQTGCSVIQLTSYPSPSAHFHYDWPSITPDNRRVVFFCQRSVGRGAPWDIFRCDTDGLNLFQLTERGDREEEGGYYGRPPAILTADGERIIVAWGTELCSIDLEAGGSNRICSLDSVCPRGNVISRLRLADSDRVLFAVRSGECPGTIRVDLPGGNPEEVDLQGSLFACVRSRKRLVVQRGTVRWATASGNGGIRRVVNAGDDLGFWSVDWEGEDPVFICPQMFAHSTLLGDRETLQGCGQYPEGCIWIAQAGRDPQRLVKGPYFWHSGPSFDGEWIAADTNWPDRGIQLVHVPSRRFRTLCRAEASQDHYEFGHPHPALSHDGRLAVFRSDRTGVPQIYLARISDEFRESVKRCPSSDPR